MHQHHDDPPQLFDLEQKLIEDTMSQRWQFSRIEADYLCAEATSQRLVPHAFSAVGLRGILGTGQENAAFGRSGQVVLQ